ncbi:hypothetical protein BJX65DRAFT_224194 [Aspergillus insuetus]
MSLKEHERYNAKLSSSRNRGERSRASPWTWPGGWPVVSVARAARSGEQNTFLDKTPVPLGLRLLNHFSPPERSTVPKMWLSLIALGLVPLGKSRH